jgi:hypothetical protein
MRMDLYANRSLRTDFKPASQPISARQTPPIIKLPDEVFDASPDSATPGIALV